MQIREALVFDDVMLVPKHSEISSRTLVDTSVKIKDFTFNHPIVPASMKTICGKEMAEAVYKSGGMALINRFMPIEEQLNIAREFYIKDNSALSDKKYFDYIGFSVGAKESSKDDIKCFIDLGVKILSIDVANGDSKLCIDMTNWIKTNCPNVLLISGNVATASGAIRLWSAGADIVRCGIGNGSICTTRMETGNGVPLLTTLIDVAEAKKDFQQRYSKRVYMMSDGGCNKAGDVCKALCFADMVMTGNTFAGSPETPGNTVSIDGRIFKEYVGSSTHGTKNIEGVRAIVPIKEGFNIILERILDGVKSCCSYQNCLNLTELKEDPQFVRITNAGYIESNHHNVIVR